MRVNRRLSMMPMPVFEYVVAHELCHLKTHDHSLKFWRILKSVLPDYVKRQEWLRQSGPAVMGSFDFRAAGLAYSE
ncbi:MAG: M48 family metallopeptidase [Elusimicrobia bacterium]|nr:M48 family metallopeptidase [Elusimicrobiota bacterium]